MDILVEDGKIKALGKDIAEAADEVFDATGLVVTPGLIDVHTHMREPGLEAISSTNYICGVAIPGVPDGVLKVFTLSSTPLPGTEMIFMNGVLMQRGTDYTIAGDVVTFSIGQEPEAGTNLTATYFV
jgi:hypothetical protein